MHTLIPIWIIGAPFLALLVLSAMFRGPSAMGGSSSDYMTRRDSRVPDPSAPLLDPMHPGAPRRNV